MADYNLISQALERGYSLDEIANKLSTVEGFDPDEIRARGYSSDEILGKLGYVAPADVPKEGSASGITGAVKNIWTGTKQTGRMVGATGEAYVGDLQGVEQFAQDSRESSAQNTPLEQRKLQEEVANINRDQGAIGQIGETLSAAGRNKMGTLQMVAEQTPNTVVSLGSGFAGMKAGAAIGALAGPIGVPVGATIGFLGGMFLGNTLLETGGKAIEKAEGGFTEEEREAAIREGAVKAGIITAVDAATFKLGGLATKSISGGLATKAGARAEAKVLMDAGVDMSTPASINMALSADKALLSAAQKAGQQAASKAISTGKKVGIAGTGLGLETVGEGVGEYAGEYAATGKGDAVDATIEALSSLTQSSVQTAYNYNKHSGNALDASGIKSASDTVLAPDATTPANPLDTSTITDPTKSVDEAIDTFVASVDDDIILGQQAPLDIQTAPILTQERAQPIQTPEASPSPIQPIQEAQNGTIPIHLDNRQMPVGSPAIGGDNLQGSDATGIPRPDAGLTPAGDSGTGLARSAEIPMASAGQNQPVADAGNAAVTNPGKRNGLVAEESQAQTTRDGVLANAQAAAPDVKEPWQMARDEYHDKNLDAVSARRAAIGKNQAGVPADPDETHIASIKQAVDQGKPVPAGVLADYPELTQDLPTQAVKPVVQPATPTVGASESAKSIKRTPTGKLSFVGYTPQQIQNAVDSIHSIATAKATKKFKGQSPDAIKLALARSTFAPKIYGVDPKGQILVEDRRGNNVLPFSKNLENALRAELTEQVSKPKRPVAMPKNMSMLQFIASKGGVNRASVASEFGYLDDIKAHKSGIFGTPAFRANGGMAWDAMGEALAEAGYLPKNEHGQYDKADLEERLVAELKGEKQHLDGDIIDNAEADRANKEFDEMRTEAETIGVDWQKYKTIDDLYVAIDARRFELSDAEEVLLNEVVSDDNADFDFDLGVEMSAARTEAWLNGVDNENGNQEQTNVAQSPAQSEGNQRGAERSSAQSEAQRQSATEVTDRRTNIAERDALYDLAVEKVTNAGRASISLIQRNLPQLGGEKGYPRAARLIAQMEANGIVGSQKSDGSREVFKPGLTLKGQNEADITAQERAQASLEATQRAEEATVKAEQAAKDQAAVDAKTKARVENPENFQFGESSKQSAAPVGDLFSQPADQLSAPDLLRAAAAKMEADAAGKITKTETNPAAIPGNAENLKQGAIQDFGEHIPGSRKDKAAALREAVASELSDENIASMPFSKIWAKESIDQIEDQFIAAVAHAARAEVPTKPKTSYKVKAWVEKVKFMRGLVSMMLDGKVTKERFTEELKKYRNLEHFAAKVALLEQIDRANWDRIGEVAEYPNAYSYDEDGKQVPKPFVRVYVDEKRVDFIGAKSVADVIDSVQEKLGIEATAKKMEFEVRVNKDGTRFINKKGDPLYRRLKTFPTSEEAQNYRRNNYAELVAAWEAVKESDNVKETDVRGKENKPRSAKDWRNGKDITPEQFASDFGFRGVQFGGWVSQGKSIKERQGMLNEAYDAFMDLSDIIGVPPRALSLNGSLGLALGARGSGKFSAHYEPGTVAINLTKTRGAGALAHEWFHATDNYFQRQRNATGLKGNAGDYITQQPENYYESSDGYRMSATKFEELRKINRIARPENWKLIEGIRPEVAEAFAELVKALNDSPMSKRASLIDKGKGDGYWSRIIERGARSFENYIIHKMMLKGYNNDYLANVVPASEFQRDAGRYPYLLEGEIQPVADAFDNLFSTIKTKETDKGLALFSRTQSPITNFTPERITEALRKSSFVGKIIDKLLARGAGVYVESGSTTTGARDNAIKSVQMRESEKIWAKKLPGMSQRLYEELAKIKPDDIGATQEGQLQELRRRLLEKGETPKTAMRTVWGDKLTNAPLELRQALERSLVMSGTSSGVTQKGVQRGGVVIAKDIEDVQKLFKEKTGRELGDDVLNSVVLPDSQYDQIIQTLEGRAAKFGRGKIEEETRNKLAGMVIGREFGETVDGFFARNPFLKVKHDAYKAWLSGKTNNAPEIMRSENGVVQGLYSPKDGLTFLISNHLTAETAPSVLLHETIHAVETPEMRQQAVTMIGQRNSPLLPAKMRQFLNEVYAKIPAKSGGDVQMSRMAQTESPAFKNWFENSVVTEDGKAGGKPLVVYHGTASDFAQFDNTKAPEDLGKNTAGVSWFSSAPEVASDFAGTQYGQKIGGLQLGNSNVMPVYLSIKNPFVDKNGLYARNGGLDKADAAVLAKDGYDGIHWPQAAIDLPDTTDQGPVKGYYRNRHGEAWGETEQGYPDQWAAFYPTQIKSATGNTRTFDPSNPDIRYSKTGETADTTEKDKAEYASYIVEHALNIGRQDGFSAIDESLFAHLTTKLGKRVSDFVRSWVAKVRAFLFKRGIVSKLYVDDLVALAQSGLGQAARGEANAGGDVISRSEQVQSSRTSPLPGMEQSTAQPPRQGNIELQGGEARKTPRFNLPEETSGQTFVRVQQNKLNRIKVVQDAIREQEGIVGATEDVYQAMERMPTRVAVKQKHFTLTVVTPLMKRIAKLDTSLEEVGTYLMALGAKDRNAFIQTIRNDMPDNGSGMTNAEAKDIIDDYRKNYPNFAEFDKLARDIQKVTDAKLNVLINGKVITQGQADEMKQAMGFYVPYKGFEVIDDAGNKVGTGLGQGYSTGKRISKKAYGRVSRAGQAVENIFRDYHAALYLAEKAHVGEYMTNLVVKNPDTTLWDIGKPEKQVVTGKDGQVQNRDMGFDNEREIRYIRNGQEFRIQVRDPLFLAAYNNLNAEQFGAIAEIASNFNSFLRQMYVQKNPNFLWRNTIRDSQTAFIAMTSEMGFTEAVKAMSLAPAAAKAAFSMVRDLKTGTEWDAYIDLADKSGALNAFAMLDDLETQQLKLEETIAKHGSQGVVQTWKRGIAIWDSSKAVKGSTLTKYGKAVTKTGQYLVYRALDNAVFNTLEALNGASENSFRLAAFRHYIDTHGGVDNVSAEVLKEASRISKNLTINFSRSGEMSTKLNAFYLFWKASVNGAANVHRILTDTPHKKQAQAITAGLFTLGVMMAMLTGDDDDELSSEYDKQHNLLIHGDGTTWKLILSYGFGFFYGAGYTTGSLLRGRITPIKAAVTTTGLFFEHFTPTGSPVIKGEFDAKAVALMASPTLLDPLTTIATNQTSFGNKLVPHYSDDDGKLDRETMYRGTRGTPYDKAANSTMLAWADISPETLKFIGNTLTGGAGGFVSDMAKTAAASFTPGKQIETEKIPLVGSVFNTKDVEEYRSRFYTQIDDVKQIASSNDKKQSQILGTSVVFWQKRMKVLREREQKAREGGNWDSVSAIEKDQIDLAKRMNTRYHNAINRLETRP